MLLRDVVEDDLAVFFEDQQDPEATRMAAFAARNHDDFMTHWRTMLPNPSATKKTIVVDDQVVGNVLAWSQDGKRLVGYWIGKPYWGRGIATAALGELVARYETSRPLYAYVAAHNVASIRVLEKCGFSPTAPPERGPDGIDELLMRLDAPAI